LSLAYVAPRKKGTFSRYPRFNDASSRAMTTTIICLVDPPSSSNSRSIRVYFWIPGQL
jgi:hypothetical protein